MRLTNQTNYATRILMYCAAKATSGENGAATIGEVAEFYQLPQPFLFKIAKVMVDAGFLSTQRGRKGGVRLSKPADEITLGEVVRATEANFELAECFRDGETACPLVATCGLNETLHEALEAFFAVLDRTSIADLAADNHNINVLQQLHAATREPLPAG